MSYNFLLYAFSIILGSWLVLVVRVIKANREIKYLKNTAVVCANLIGGNDKVSENLRKFGEAASKAGVLVSGNKFPSVEPDDYADKDGDGTPDVFQRRKPLSEMLEFEKPPQDASLLGEVDSPGRRLCAEFDDSIYPVLVELPARSPRKGEYFLCGNMIVKAAFNYSSRSSDFLIIKSVPGTNLDDLVDLTK